MFLLMLIHLLLIMYVCLCVWERQTDTSTDMDTFEMVLWFFFFPHSLLPFIWNKAGCYGSECLHLQQGSGVGCHPELCSEFKSGLSTRKEGKREKYIEKLLSSELGRQVLACGVSQCPMLMQVLLVSCALIPRRSRKAQVSCSKDLIG